MQAQVVRYPKETREKKKTREYRQAKERSGRQVQEPRMQNLGGKNINHLTGYRDAYFWIIGQVLHQKTQSKGCSNSYSMSSNKIINGKILA